jgi:uncharacterized protein YegL
MAMSKVLVNFIQDRSGSMSTVWDETLSGFKSFLADLKKGCQEDGIEYLFSLTTFDTQVETPIVTKPVGEIEEDALNPHGPRGGTALYDAVGKTIKDTETDSCGADKIIVVIVTDGQENSSREWSKEALHASIEAKLKLGNWTFTYLGTQPETWDDAHALGIADGSTSTYTGHMANAAYAATAGAVRSMSRSSAMGCSALMDNHIPVAARKAAGMGTKPTPTRPTRPTRPTPPTVPTTQKSGNHTKDSRRWR